MNFPLNVLKKIQENLSREKHTLTSTISSLKSQDPFSDPERLNDNAASDTDASEEISHERMVALEKELKHRMTDIEEALLRLKTGTYGKCFSCGKMIDHNRLDINPTARMCVSCEKKKESKIRT